MKDSTLQDSKVPTWLYIIVLLLTIHTPGLAPFTATVIAQRPRVVNTFITLAVCTMPVALIIIAQLYAWSLLLEILGIEEGKRFRQAISGQKDDDLAFNS